MARFDVLEFRKNHDICRYFAKISFENGEDWYEIRTDANINYLDWLGEISILNGFDMPFYGEPPHLEITGLSFEAQKKEKRLEQAFFDFIEEEYMEE